MGSHLARSLLAALSTSGVHIQPGLTTLTRILSGARSSAWHLVMVMIAPLVALYVQRLGWAICPEMLAILTIAPPPADFMCRWQACAILAVPRTLTPKLRSQSGV